MTVELKRIAELYKALGDETRLNIVQMLSEQEMCVCEVLDRLEMSQPAVSHHLKILKQAGIVKDSREGKWVYYSLNSSVFDNIFDGEKGNVLEVYSKPLNEILQSQKSSSIRTDDSLCEKLTAKGLGGYEYGE